MCNFGNESEGIKLLTTEIEKILHLSKMTKSKCDEGKVWI